MCEREREREGVRERESERERVTSLVVEVQKHLPSVERIFSLSRNVKANFLYHMIVLFQVMTTMGMGPV